MGSIVIGTVAFEASLSEILGIKAGLAIGKEELNKLLRDDDALRKYADLPDDGGLRIHSSAYEEVVEALLYKVGRLAKPQNLLPGIRHFHKYRRDSERWPVVSSVLEIFVEWQRTEIARLRETDEKVMDHEPIMRLVFGRYGKFGLEILMELFEEQQAYIFRSPWGGPETTQWKDVVELRTLFESEGLDAQYGNFFDQRFIDFLNRNFDSVDDMHWRKFEQLTAEYLDRTGYLVELGPGRGDDGVDVRAWPKDQERGLAPALIVQCKRQKAKVEKVIIKSLYADVIHEDAAKGLVVTTSRLSAGALETAEARRYPIEVADRETLKKWIDALHTPGSGVITL